jgi:hypothetical protein
MTNEFTVEAATLEMAIEKASQVVADNYGKPTHECLGKVYTENRTTFELVTVRGYNGRVYGRDLDIEWVFKYT